MTENTGKPKDPLTDPAPWNAVAVGYDEEFFDQLPEMVGRAIALLAPPASATVLDVGAGPGTLAIRLAPRVKRVVAVDFAEAMIERLRGHASRERIPNIEAHVMDGQALALPSDAFDAAASLFGWFLFGDRVRGLSEMFRVVRPGGRVLVTSWAPVDRNTVLGAGLQAIREALPQLPRPPGPLPTQVPEVCRAEMEQVGFRDVGTEVVTVPVTFDDVEVYFRTFERAGAPFVVLRQKLGEAAFGDAVARARAHLRERFGSGPVTLQAEAIFTFGTR